MNTGKDRKSDQRNESADIAMHQTATVIINGQTENHYLITAKGGTLGKFADPNILNNEKLQKNAARRDQGYRQRVIPTCR